MRLAAAPRLPAGSGPPRPDAGPIGVRSGQDDEEHPGCRAASTVPAGSPLLLPSSGPPDAGSARAGECRVPLLSCDRAPRSAPDPSRDERYRSLRAYLVISPDTIQVHLNLVELLELWRARRLRMNPFRKDRHV